MTSQSSTSSQPSRVSQEFYCNDCDGYFIARLNVGINKAVLVVCPNCGHEHRREIKKGVIVENYSDLGRENRERIMVPKTSYSKAPLSKQMKSGAHWRKGAEISDIEMREIWAARAARERGEEDEE